MSEQESHQASADSNGDEVLLLHEFFFYGKASPVDILFSCLLPFPKDHIGGSGFSDVSFFVVSGFTQSSHVNVEMDQLATHNHCASLWALHVLDVH